MKATCPHCGSENVYGISRVVGYYSIINNWNLSKVAELKARQQGNYNINKKGLNMDEENEVVEETTDEPTEEVEEEATE